MRNGGLILSAILALYSSSAIVSAGRPREYVEKPDQEGQYFRLGACPDPHACILPPDMSQFLPGAYFDLRVELHDYDKEAANAKDSAPPVFFDNFKTQVRRNHGPWKDIDHFFGAETPALENWHYNWTHSIDSRFNGAPKIDVSVNSRIWRKLKFDKPGVYDVSVQYGPKSGYTVRYNVIEPKRPKHKAKNVILFIADGCNVGMIAAARSLSRKHTSGKYHNLLNFEKFDHLGHVITNSVDAIVTDSANSASAYSTGHKSSASALGVYADSSETPFDDPKVELITELIRRRQPGKAIGIVSTAAGEDATPAAFYVHTRDRNEMAAILDQLVHGVANWTDPVIPDVWLAGGAEYFKGEMAQDGTNYYDILEDLDYKIVSNKKELNKYHGSKKLIGTFRKSHLDTWFERNIFVNNTVGNEAGPNLDGKDALGADQPGLDDMTLKALEVLKKRGGDDGFFLMAEGASVDKKLHTLDFPRALADLLEVDVTIKKTVEWLKKNGEFEDTLILFTADHAHGFDVYGSVNQQYVATHRTDAQMRSAVGLYEYSGWPGYKDEDGDGFPDNWLPDVVLASGSNNGPDHFESWKISHDSPREPAVEAHGKYIANVHDAAGKDGKGIEWHGNIPVTEAVDSHTMTDVFIYANGPGSEYFSKTHENWELFYGMTQAMDIQKP
ncbi:alkaline-phosphatase-like protein [Dichotomocladium elegans]|nr:alkaline-phosphatase-like protein [Dichotomocladium elegans]